MSLAPARAGARAGRPVLLALAVLAAGHAAAADAKTKPAKTTKLSPLAVRSQGKSAACKASGRTLRVGGRCRWVTTVQFKVPAGVSSAKLVFTTRHTIAGTLRVRGTGAEVLDSVKRAKGHVVLDVAKGVPAAGGAITLSLDSSSSTPERLRSAVLEVRTSPGGGATTIPGSGTTSGGGTSDSTAGAAKKKPPAAPTAPAPAAPVAAPPATPAPVVPPAPGGNPVAPTSSSRVWVGADDLRARPTSGPAWNALKSAADGSPGTPDVADQNSSHDVNTLAAALVYARIGGEAYRAKVAAAISGAIGTEAGGRTLALGRNLSSYVIAADLIGLGGYDPALDGRFRAWIGAARTENLSGLTLISTHEKRPNNWGTMAGASRIAADLYLGDGADLARAAAVFRGYLGDRSAYAGFDYGDVSYQSDPARPVGINPPGATKSGVDVDGAIPDDMRRGCSFQPVPCHTGYPWEALQGVVTQAELLSHHGMPAFSWSSNAVLRAAQYLQRIDQRFGGWWASSDDTWQPWLINHAYGTALPAAQGGYAGKVFGWTTWVYGA
jgi:hypothetical protein